MPVRHWSKHKSNRKFRPDPDTRKGPVQDPFPKQKKKKQKRLASQRPSALPNEPMLTDRTPSENPSYETDLVLEGSGLYRREVGSAEDYLYSRFEQHDSIPSKEELKALRGSYSWRKRQGKRVRVKSPSLLYLPLVADTEYQTLPNQDAYPDFYEYMLDPLHRVDRGSLPLTVQLNTLRPTVHGIGTYVHPMFKQAFPRARPILETPKNPVEAYLKRLFPTSRIQEFEELSDPSLVAMRKVRVLRLDVYAHFAVADFLKMWPAGSVHDHLINLVTGEEGTIDQTRRLKVERETKWANGHTSRTRWVAMPAMVTINGVKFALELSVVDSSAMAGQAGMSLAGFHACAGVAMDAKDNYQRSQKQLMLLQFVAACDREGIERGVYEKVSRTLPGKLDEALIACDTYTSGNLFVDYAEGDVNLYEAIDSFDRQFLDLYQSLGLNDYFRSPRYTVGSTVHSLLQAAVYRFFENGEPLAPAVQKFLVEHGFEPARARGLAEGSSWAAANARVFGGRVLSTAPTLVSRKGASICDMDLAGAYARSMDIQLLPVGTPVIDLKFTRAKSKRNRYPTLGEYLAKYEKSFVPGCWQMLISCEKDGKPLELPVDQDYFISWDTPAIFDNLKCDEEEQGVWLERSDDVKVFTRQILNSILTHDGLDWLRYAASKKLRNFVMENAQVKASLFYPAEERVENDDPQEWLRLIREAQGNGRQNTCDVDVKKGNTELTSVEREAHTWIAIPVSDLLTDALTKERKRWKAFTREYDLLRKKGVTCVEQLSKLTPSQLEEFDRLANAHEGGHPDGAQGLIEASLKGGKHAKDELAKLCSNTVYGDLVSRFFALSNPCVGNNITARVRSIIWYFEKSCRAWNSITDGGLFDLNEVHAIRENRRGRLNESNTVFALQGGYKALSKSGIVLRPLGYNEEDPVLSWGWNGERVVITRESGTYEEEVAAAQVQIDRMTLAHVQNSFDHRIAVINPKVSPFEFEAKGVVKDAAIHGTANYCLRGGKHGSYKDGKDWTIKLRSYPESTHETILKPFFDQLIDNPEAVDRTRYWEPFTLGSVLKVRKFRDSFSSHFHETILEPGDTEYNIKVFREFTPSAFRFRTRAQEKKFVAFHQSRRDIGNAKQNSIGSAKGQSFESFFTNENNVLNYSQMMAEVEAAIRGGKTNIHPELEIKEHPQQEKAIRMKRKLWRDVVKKDRRYETIDFHQVEIDLEIDPDGLIYTDDLYL